MADTEALARVLLEYAISDDRTHAITHHEQAERILADPGPLLAALHEAGVLERTEEALIHYRYGVNTGTLLARNTPESIAGVIRRHEVATHGHVGVERTEVRTRYEHVTDWRPADA